MALVDHLEKLKHFRLVARAGSFIKAARLAHQSQPALMYSIKALETELGVTLFTRSRVGVKLTATGSQLLEFATDLERRTRDIEQAIGQSSGFATTYTIASHTPYLPSMLLPHDAQIAKALGIQRLNFKSNLSSQQLVTWVESGVVDIALIADHPIPKTLRATPVFYDWYDFYCSQEFVKTKFKRQILNQNAEWPLIYLANSVAGPLRTLERALWEVGIHSPSLVEVDSYEAAASVASLGHGIAVLPRKTLVSSYFSLQRLRTGKELRELGRFCVHAVYKDPSLDKHMPKLVRIFNS
jgi:LysR family transcriptional regulator, nitrogen assimilation regulatory protein